MERFCADPVARSVNHPPHPAGAVVSGAVVSWSAGQLASGCHWSGCGAAGRVSEMVKTCCKCLNYCHNTQLGQQLGPFLVVNATTANAALVQPDERRRELGPRSVLWPSVPVVVPVLRWSAAAPLTVPRLAWSAVAVEAVPMQSAGTDRRR